MRRSYKILSAALCAAISMTALTSCSLPSVKKNTKTVEKEKPSGEEKSEDSSKSESESKSPVIENAQSYVTLPDYDTVKLSSKEIDKQVEENKQESLKAYSKKEKIKKGTVKKGDTVNIYYVGKLNGKAFDGGSCTKKDTPEGFDLKIGSHNFIEGFEEQLIGKKIGKTVKIHVTFPESYPQNEDLAGKKTEFTVTLNHKVKEVLPKFTDKFVKKKLSSYKSVADYEKKTRVKVKEDMALKKVVDKAKVNNYPDGLVEEKQKSMQSVIEESLASNNTTLDDYLSAQKISKEDFMKQMNEAAENDISTQCIYYAIAQKENLSVEQSEYDKELKNCLANYGCKTEAELDKRFMQYYGSNAKTVIYMNIMYTKISEFLGGKVKES